MLIDMFNDFLHELKDQGLFIIRHISGDSFDADVFMKSMMSDMFNHRLPLNVGTNEYVLVLD